MAASRLGLLFIVILVAALATLAGCGFSLSATAYQTSVPLRGSCAWRQPTGEPAPASSSMLPVPADLAQPRCLCSANLSSPTATATSPFLLPSSAPPPLPRFTSSLAAANLKPFRAAATLLLSSRQCWLLQRALYLQFHLRKRGHHRRLSLASCCLHDVTLSSWLCVGGCILSQRGLQRARIHQYCAGKFSGQADGHELLRRKQQTLQSCQRSR